MNCAQGCWPQSAWEPVKGPGPRCGVAWEYSRVDTGRRGGTAGIAEEKLSKDLTWRGALWLCTRGQRGRQRVWGALYMDDTLGRLPHTISSSSATTLWSRSSSSSDSSLGSSDAWCVENRLVSRCMVQNLRLLPRYRYLATM